MLSRVPVEILSPDDTYQCDLSDAYVMAILDSLPATEKRLAEIKLHLSEDPVCREIMSYCQDGWPEIRYLRDSLKLYYPVREELTVENGLLLRGTRLVTPSSLRLSILEKIHEGHQGIVKCRERARAAIWWPNFSKQVEELVRSCVCCAQNSINRAEPLLTMERPSRPWQKVATDLFVWKGKTYLLVVDYFSRWIELALLTDSTSTGVINHLQSIISRYGIPEKLFSDNGPQYASREFADFVDDYGIMHVTSSPQWPQSNGEAERAVKTVKNLLQKGSNSYKAMLAYRTTPLRNGFSPSQLLMGRMLKTSLPTYPVHLEPCWPDLELVRQREDMDQSRQKKNFDSRHAAHHALPTLNPGDDVFLRDGNRIKSGVIQDHAHSPRSYIVETPQNVYRRNRRSLIPVPTARSPGNANTEGFRQCVEQLSPGTTTNINEGVHVNSPSMSDRSENVEMYTRSGRISRPPVKLNL